MIEHVQRTGNKCIVTFDNGNRYEYEGMTEKQLQEFMSAKHRDSHFFKHIRHDKTITYKKLSLEDNKPRGTPVA